LPQQLQSASSPKLLSPEAAADLRSSLPAQEGSRSDHAARVLVRSTAAWQLLVCQSVTLRREYDATLESFGARTGDRSLPVTLRDLVIPGRAFHLFVLTCPRTTQNTAPRQSPTTLALECPSASRPLNGRNKIRLRRC